MSNYLDQIASYVCQCSFDDFPSNVVIKAKQVLADSFAVIAAGAQEAEVKSLSEKITLSSDPQIATLLNGGKRTEPMKAAFLNGTAGTFLELDEGNQFARGHPGMHIVPAALAVAEEYHLSGRQLITALILGYEIGARIGIASKLRMSMHPHGTWGTVGAAVAVGKLLGYDEQTLKEIINLSSSLALATSRKTMLEGGTVRNVYSGVTGLMGILAHQLIDCGFIGEADGLQTVFGNVVSETFEPEVMVDELGTRFEIARNYFKQYACCRYNHGTLDALQVIASKLPGGKFAPQQVAKIAVSTYSLAAQLSSQSPKNILAAKFSIPFAVATFIVNGQAGISAFTSETVKNSTIKDLAHKVTVKEDLSLTALMPHKRPSRVRVTFTDGREIEAETLINKGDFEDPYTDDELERKYYALTGPIWGQKVAEQIFSGIMTLEDSEDVMQVTKLLA